MTAAITEDVMKRAAEFLRNDENQQPQSSKHADISNPFLFEGYLRSHNIRFKTRDSSTGTKYLIQCPFNPEHAEDAAVWQHPDGKLAGKCFHNGCSEKHWPDFRKAISGSESLLQYFQDQPLGSIGVDSAAMLDGSLPEPIPFDGILSLPNFPIDALPEGVGRDMVKAVSETHQIDEGFAACSYFGALSTAALGKYRIDMGTHHEYENVFVIGILNSGERKSPTQSAMTRPLYAYQDEIQSHMRPVIVAASNARRFKENKIKQLQSDAVKAKDPGRSEAFKKEAAEIAQEMSSDPVPTLPVLIVDDITPEKLGEMMAANGGKIAMISAEGGIFDILGGRYSGDGKANIDLYLKAFSHDYYASHRIGRESVSMASPSLVLCLGVQPSVVEEIGKNERFRGKGLLARCLFACCKPRAGSRTYSSVRVPEELTRQYQDLIVSLARIEIEDPMVLRLSNAALDVWKIFFGDVERELGPSGSLFHAQDWGSKLPGAVVRIAGLLHFAQHGTDAGLSHISGELMERACRIGKYYEEHAKAVFSLMTEPPETKVAKTILDFILREKPEKFKARMIFNHTNLRTMNDIEPGLKLLCERAYLFPIEPDRNHKPGRPESKSYTVNPKIM